MSQDSFGRYQILRQLGEGGMATVFLAHDPRFKRDVALKVLPAQWLGDDEFRARFDREARTVAALEHAAIVPVYDFGEEAGQPYLVMRYMAGGSLGDRIRRGGPLPVSETLRLAERLAGALDKAHSRGIVHRDLKPENILFDDDGEAFIADFGIAKLTESTTKLTQGVIGTPAYMSPEQFNPKLGLTGKADQYALAILVFEMLSGKLPFDADTAAELMFLHFNEPPPPVSAVRPGVPEAVDAVLQRALAKQPDGRFVTCRALVDALHAASDGHADDLDDLLGEHDPAPLDGLETRIVDHIAEGADVDAPAGEPDGPPAISVDTGASKRPQHQTRPATMRSATRWVAGGIAALVLTGLVVVGLLFGDDLTGTLVAEATPVPPTARPTATPVPLSEYEQLIVSATEFNGSNRDWAPVEMAFSNELLDFRMVLVPAGCFTMGSDALGDMTRPEHEQCLETPFWLDRTEVSWAEFIRCVETGGCSEPGAPRPAIESSPVTNVTWQQALDYCMWRDSRLPTEREWEYAARGPESWLFPWGNAYDADLVAPDFLMSVTMRPEGASWVGALHMAGNAAEWTASRPEPYPYDPGDGRETRSRPAGDRVIRSGVPLARRELAFTMMTGVNPDLIGFRCARNP